MSQDDVGKTTHLVTNRDELEEALKLVHYSYVRSGYMREHESGLRFNIHYASPATRTIVNVVNEDITSTVSLFSDSNLGLPLDSIYPREADELRQMGRRPGEAGMLADRRSDIRRSVKTVLDMMRMLYWTAMEIGLTDLMVTVNPKHVTFYTNLFCFEQFGAEKSYDAVDGAPAVLLRMNIADLKEEDFTKPRVRRMAVAPPADWLGFDKSYQMCAEDLGYFLGLAPDVLRNASQREIEVIEAMHPSLDLEPLLAPASH